MSRFKSIKSTFCRLLILTRRLPPHWWTAGVSAAPSPSVTPRARSRYGAFLLVQILPILSSDWLIWSEYWSLIDSNLNNELWLDLISILISDWLSSSQYWALIGSPHYNTDLRLVQGNCLTVDSTGAQWCYVDSEYSSCQDLVPSLRYSHVTINLHIFTRLCEHGDWNVITKLSFNLVFYFFRYS